MNVLIACEFSGTVREAFRRHGHSAWSCDIIPDSSGVKFPSHYQCDARKALNFKSWDLVIAHPPCTHLAVSGARWFKDHREEQEKAIEFFMEFIDCAPRVCIENPIGIMSTKYRKPDQIIQPWMFGHPETKATCLWLRKLPLLHPSNVVEGRSPRIHHESPGIKNGLTRAQRRSITYQGIAEAMAQQWLPFAEHWAKITQLGTRNPISQSWKRWKINYLPAFGR